MKLKRFVATKIHGFLNFDIKFDASLSLLTGINGSGKTSALNALIALIGPDLRVLAGLEFAHLSIEVKDNDRTLRVEANKSDDRIYLNVSGSDDPMSFRVYTPDEDLPSIRQSEAESEHYHEVLSSFVDHPVIKALLELPNPMFLGLDRRAQFDERLNKRLRHQNFRPVRRAAKNIFGSSLARSLDDAASLVETKYRDALIASASITSKLQKELLLNLLSVPDRDGRGYGSLKLPSKQKIKEIGNLKSNLIRLSLIFDLEYDYIKNNIEPFLDSMVKYASNIPDGRSVESILKAIDGKDELSSVDSLFNWSSNEVHLDRINVISDIVKKYNSYRDDLLKPFNTYLKLIGDYLLDSGKSVNFNDRGYLYVDIDGIESERSISSLSSGEAQIFVILTHLLFNDSAQNNVFIIDEPELSLHVQWQEIFVDSLISANPSIQYIMATHAPSIILEKVGNCIDISRKIGGR
ncbi:AAA family ATPase [Agrobacterium vitis]